MYSIAPLLDFDIFTPARLSLYITQFQSIAGSSSVSIPGPPGPPGPAGPAGPPGLSGGSQNTRSSF